MIMKTYSVCLIGGMFFPFGDAVSTYDAAKHA
jgi:hypothetical protein